MSIVRTLLIGLALVNVGLLLAAGSASAELSGGCSGTIGTANPAVVSSSDTADALSVEEGGSVPWSLTAPAEITAWHAVLHYGPFSATVGEGSDPADDDEPDTTKSSVAAVDDYTWMGVGLYQLDAVVVHEAGSCTGSVLINVEGNPLTTVVGGGAAVVTVGGAVGLGGAALSGLKGATISYTGLE